MLEDAQSQETGFTSFIRGDFMAFADFRFLCRRLARLTFRVGSPIAALALFLSLSGANAFAAEPSTIQGVVTDPLGAAVYNARIDVLTVNGIMLPVHAHTDGRGQYTISVNEPGRYVVRVIATGFNVTNSDQIYLGSAKTSFVDV